MCLRPASKVRKTYKAKKRLLIVLALVSVVAAGAQGHTGCPTGWTCPPEIPHDHKNPRFGALWYWDHMPPPPKPTDASQLASLWGPLPSATRQSVLTAATRILKAHVSPAAREVTHDHS